MRDAPCGARKCHHPSRNPGDIEGELAEPRIGQFDRAWNSENGRTNPARPGWQEMRNLFSRLKFGQKVQNEMALDNVDGLGKTNLSSIRGLNQAGYLETVSYSASGLDLRESRRDRIPPNHASNKAVSEWPIFTKFSEEPPEPMTRLLLKTVNGVKAAGATAVTWMLLLLSVRVSDWIG